MIKPSTFFINVTNRCNLTCKHCYALKDDIEMTPEVLHIANDYVVEQINTTNEEDYVVNYTGGEVGVYDQNAIIDSVNYIKDCCKHKNIKFIYQSNFVYKITPLHFETMKLMDEIASSYDIGTCRFKSSREKKLWLDNIHYLRKLFSNKDFRLSIVVNTEMTKVPPQVLLDLIMSLDVHVLEVNSMQSDIMSGTTTAYLHMLPPTNELREWLYQLFREYETVRKHYDLIIPDFECLRNSFEGKNFWVYSRECCLRNRTISADGKLSTCLMTQIAPIYDLVAKKELNSLDAWHQSELTLPNICRECKYLRYCKGGCQFYQFDEYGCATPTKIYDYLELKREMTDE